MHTTILQLLITISQALYSEGLTYESYQVDRMCGVVDVATVVSELDYVVPYDSVVRPAVGLAKHLDGDVIVNLTCDFGTYYWTSKE